MVWYWVFVRGRVFCKVQDRDQANSIAAANGGYVETVEIKEGY